MDELVLDVIVIGAGHAGLAVSYYLKQCKLNHVVFEKGETGESWQSQRWDSFKMNTPNKLNVLPAMNSNSDDAENFFTAPEFLESLKNYAAKFDLPVREQCQVLEIRKDEGSNSFSVSVSENATFKLFKASQVIVASGSRNKKYIPGFAENISPCIFQLHTSEYRNAKCLPDGAVLVVGSGQSGAQVAEDLVESGRKVFLATSRVGRIPRRYRGRDIEDWFVITGYYDMRTEDVTDPTLFTAKQPIVSGVGYRGRTISLQSLAKKGVVLLGKIENADKDMIVIKDNANENIRFGDECSEEIKKMIDDYIIESKLTAPNPELDPADLPDINSTYASNITSLNLSSENISTVIWATGFVNDLNYLKFPVFSENGLLKHRNGVSEMEGLYFIGLPWIRTIISGIVWGINEDAEYLAERILAHHTQLHKA